MSDLVVNLCTPDADDLNYLVEYIVSEGVPCTTDMLARRLLERRIAISRDERIQCVDIPPDTVIFQKSSDYEVGQRVYVGTLGRIATVESKEPAELPKSDGSIHKGFYIRFEGIQKKFFCSKTYYRTMPDDLELKHLESADAAASILEEVGEPCRDALKAKLREDNRFVTYDRQWFIYELMSDSLNELPTTIEAFLIKYAQYATLDQIVHGILEDPSDPVQRFIVGWCLENSGLFVKGRDSPPFTWAAQHAAPGVSKPTRKAIPAVSSRYKRSQRTRSKAARPIKRTKPKYAKRKYAIIAVPVGYREAGLVPLNNKTIGLFPEQGRGPDERPIWIVDAMGGERFEARISYSKKCFGGPRLMEWFDSYLIPPGGIITLERTDRDYEIKIGFERSTGQKLQVRVLRYVNGELVARTEERVFPCKVDKGLYEHSVIFEDLKAMEIEAEYSIFDTICMVFEALSNENNEHTGYVHYKTIASAVSYIRRCSPRTVLSLLSRYPCFRSKGEGLWEFDREAVINIDEVDPEVANSMLWQIMSMDKKVKSLRERISTLLNRAKEQHNAVYFGETRKV